jgi:chromosome segregation ATPase
MQHDLTNCEASLQQSRSLHSREVNELRQELKQLQEAAAAAEIFHQSSVARESQMQQRLVQQELDAAASLAQSQGLLQQAQVALEEADAKYLQQVQLLRESESARVSAEDQVLLLTKQVNRLQAQLVLSNSNTTEVQSSSQEQVRQAHSGRIAAEGLVQSLTQQNMSLEKQLRLHEESLVDARSKVEELQLRATELTRENDELRAQMIAASSELEELGSRAAALETIAERALYLFLFGFVCVGVAAHSFQSEGKLNAFALQLKEAEIAHSMSVVDRQQKELVASAELVSGVSLNCFVCLSGGLGCVKRRRHPRN